MYPLDEERPLTVYSSGNEPQVFPTLNELTKKMHFFRFLQKEINTAKTQAEKEAVVTILMKTRIQIRALQKEWRQLQALQRSVPITSQTTSALCAPQRLQ